MYYNNNLFIYLFIYNNNNNPVSAFIPIHVFSCINNKKLLHIRKIHLKKVNSMYKLTINTINSYKENNTCTLEMDWAKASCQDGSCHSSHQADVSAAIYVSQNSGIGAGKMDC